LWFTDWNTYPQSIDDFVVTTDKDDFWTTCKPVCGNGTYESWEECGEPNLGTCQSTKFEQSICSPRTCTCVSPSAPKIPDFADNSM
jgi:hypothetical protein